MVNHPCALYTGPCHINRPRCRLTYRVGLVRVLLDRGVDRASQVFFQLVEHEVCLRLVSAEGRHPVQPPEPEAPVVPLRSVGRA